MNSKTVTGAPIARILLCLAILSVSGCREEEPGASPQAAIPEPAGSADAADAVQEPAAHPWPRTHEEYIANVPMLIDGLLTPELSPEVRAWTAQQLARASLEDARVDAALRKALEDPEVADAAAAALAQRTELGAEPSPEKAERPGPPDAGAAAPAGMRIETLD